MTTASSGTPGAPGGANPDLGKLARGGALNLVGAMCAGLMGFVLIVAVVRTYDQALAGAFFAATSLFLILNAVSGLGSDAGLLRWVPHHLARGERTNARRTVPIALVPVLATACLAGLVMVVTAPWFAELVHGDSPGETTSMLRVLGLFLPAAAAQDALLAATRGHGSMRPTVLVDKIFRQVAQVGGVLVAYAVGGDATVLALAWSLPYVPGVLIAAVLYRGLARRAGRGGTPAPVRELAGPFWRFTAPRSLAQICQTALQRSDIVLIAALASPRDAAIYTAATRFIVFGQLAAQSLQQVMQPAVSRHMAMDDVAGAQRVMAVGTTWTVAVTWPLYLTLAAGAHVFLMVFSPEYAAEGQSTTIVLALTMLLATAVGPADVVLLMAGRSGLSLGNNAAALVVNMVLNVVLIPLFGVPGAAAARAAALGTRNVLPLLQIRRILHISPTGAGLWRSIAYAVICFGMLPVCVQAALGTTVPALVLGVALGTAGYAVLLWTGRERLSLTAFKALLRRRGAGRSPAAPSTPAERTVPPMDERTPRPPARAGGAFPAGAFPEGAPPDRTVPDRVPPDRTLPDRPR
ncbi:hypothetical protein GCM10010182_39080 [Actinomadura cremea]|nr:hypothetical protein GCM10010182_39080 [Actinomadura cremea]